MDQQLSRIFRRGPKFYPVAKGGFFPIDSKGYVYGLSDSNKLEIVSDERFKMFLRDSFDVVGLNANGEIKIYTLPEEYKTVRQMKILLDKGVGIPLNKEIKFIKLSQGIDATMGSHVLSDTYWAIMEMGKIAKLQIDKETSEPRGEYANIPETEFAVDADVDMYRILTASGKLYLNDGTLISPPGVVFKDFVSREFGALSSCITKNGELYLYLENKSIPLEFPDKIVSVVSGHNFCFLTNKGVAHFLLILPRVFDVIGFITQPIPIPKVKQLGISAGPTSKYYFLTRTGDVYSVENYRGGHYDINFTKIKSNVKKIFSARRCYFEMMNGRLEY